jgi:hypothetical protein
MAVHRAVAAPSIAKNRNRKPASKPELRRGARATGSPSRPS